MYLDSFAELFAGAGLNALVFDNRNFGASDGEPRQEIDLWAQVDAGRIGIWGSSHSGGHVLVVAAIERRVKAVLSQVPLVSGHANLRALVRAAFIAGLREQFDADRQVDADEFAAQVSGVAALAEPAATCTSTWRRNPDRSAGTRRPKASASPGTPRSSTWTSWSRKGCSTRTSSACPVGRGAAPGGQPSCTGALAARCR